MKASRLEKRRWHRSPLTGRRCVTAPPAATCCPNIILTRADRQPDGRLVEGSPSHGDDGFSTFFSETGSGKYVPRSLYVSLA